jgi:hypothetical protein
MGQAQTFAIKGVNLKDYLAAESKVFVASAGSATTPLTAVAFDLDKPEITISVPTGTTMIPIRVEIVLESFAGTDNEIIVWRTKNAIPAGTSTAMTEGPTSTRTGSAFTSAATARILHTANVTQTSLIELWRGVQPLADTNPGAFVWEPKEYHFLEGDATLGVQVAGTTTQPTFYGKVIFAEMPSGWLD